MADGSNAVQDARQLLAQGRLAEAEQRCLAHLKQQPRDVEALRLAADLARRGARGTQARDLLTRALRTAPAHPGVRLELGQLLIEQAQPADALALLQDAPLAGDALADIRHLRGVALRALKRFDDAQGAWLAALEVDPQRPATHFALADLLRQRGRLPAAQRHLEAVLARLPDALPVRVALADVLSMQRQFGASLSVLREVEARSADNPGPVWCRIGMVLKEMGDRPGALEILGAAVARDPRSPEAHFYLAEAQLSFGAPAEASRHAAEAMRLGAGGEAVRQLRSAALAAAGDLQAALLVMRAADSPARPVREYLRVLGNRLARAGLRDVALECYRQLLAADPADREAAHIAAALARQNPDHPQLDYVREHFDTFAASFDQQLDGLGYAGPAQLRAALESLPASTPAPWAVLDLGCGTGLMAVALAGLAARIDGVDLSPRMIERARARGLYASLDCDDLRGALARGADGTYDLVTAADVFIYVGRLEETIAAIRRVLKPGGLLAFTAEDADRALDPGDTSRGYWLQYTGRYAHTAAYLDSLAAENGFRVCLRQPAGLRLESGQVVAAWITVWSRDR